MKFKHPILLFVEFLKSETTGLLHIKKFDIDNAFPESFGYVSYDEYCRVVEPLQKKNDDLIRVIELADMDLAGVRMHKCMFDNDDNFNKACDDVINTLSEIRKLKGE